MASNKSKKNKTNPTNRNNNNVYKNDNRPLPSSSPAIKKQKNRDSDFCSINFIKYVLLIFDIIFFMSGLGVICAAVWTILFKHQFVALLSSSTYLFCTYSLLIAGIIAVFGGVAGFCGVWRENRSIILVYILMLILVFILEASAGAFAFIYERNVKDELDMTLSDNFKETYGIRESHTNAIDLMQQKFMCCGAVRFEEYRQSAWLRSKRTDMLRPTEGQLVPDSCCTTVTDRCGISDHPSNIPYTGCIYQFTDDLRAQLVVIGSVGLGICIIQIFGIILSSSLYIKLKKLHEQSFNQTPVSLLAADRDRVSFIYGSNESDDELPEPPSSISHNRISIQPISERPLSMSYDRIV